MLTKYFFKKPANLLSFAILTALLSSCYSGARTDNMSVGEIQNADFGKYSHNLRLVDAENATRGDSRVSDKNFRQALENSLYVNGILNNSNPEYELRANITQLTPPSMNFNMYVTADIQYEIQSIGDKKIIVDKTIESRASASSHDENMILSRKREANERAINQNIEGFIGYLRR